MIKKVKEKIAGTNESMTINMAISTICKPISMIISYIYVPIILNYLGVEKYGVWATILTILSWIGYFDIGIGNGLRNKLTESLSKNDGQSRKLVSSAYAFIAVIMILAAIAFSVVASFADWNRIFGVDDIQEKLSAVVIMSVCFVSINFILSICRNVLYSLQKAAYVSVMELATQILNLIGVLVAMQFVKSNLFVMSLVYGLSMVTVNTVASVLIYRKNKTVRPSFNFVDIKMGNSITNLGMQFFVIQICALILFTTDSLIISYLYGAADVTPYNTVNKLFNVIIGVFSALLAPVWSNVTKLKAENNYDGIKNLVNKIYALCGFFACGAILLMFMFKPISRLWLGQELNYSNGLILFGACYCIFSMWTNMNGTIANGLNILKEQMVMAIVQASVNIPLSIIFAEYCNLGNAGILLGTNFSLLISCIILPILIKNRLAREESAL